MPDAWAALIDAGKIGGALEDLTRLRKARGLLPEEAVAECELLDIASSSDHSLDKAEALLRKPDLRKDLAARCLAVIGSQHLRMSRTEPGRIAFERAKKLAREVGSKDLAAKVYVACLGSIATWIGPDAAAPEVIPTKGLVMAAGHSELSIRYRLILAELEVKRGALRRAQAHLEVAGGLLSRFDNAALRADHRIRGAAAAMLSSDLTSALALSREAVRLSRDCGSVSLEVVARTNLAHIFLSLGDKRDSKVEFDAASRLCRSGGGAELGIRDGIALHSLGFDSEALTEASMQEALELSAQLEGGYSYYGLWHLHTRARWLLRTNRAQDAVTLALDAIPRIERMADRNLLERMQLVAAEALGAAGRPLDGAALLASTVRANPDPSLEIVAEAARVAGCLATDDPAAARAHFERAIRIFSAIGQHTAAADVRRQAGLGDTAALPAITSGTARLGTSLAALAPAPTARGVAPARVIETSAAVTNLAAHPPLLGIEVMTLLGDAGACTRAALVEEDQTGVRRTIVTRTDGPAPATTDTATPIPLGALGTRRYELLVEPRPSPSARTTVLAVERLAHTSVTLSRMRRDERERTSLWPEQSPEEQLGLVYTSEAMVELVNTTRRIAPSKVTVLITGETGAGKEVIARALHQASGRHDATFLPFNCTTVPREMLDSQLFGYRRGAFTGAGDEYPGLIRSAAGGTLFLDEIGEMPADLQPKLLRFLESGEVLPLGETRPVTVDVRIVAATNADLEQLVNEGRFREDLYYRLNVIRLRVPPLRERREEVPLLVQAMLERFARESQRDPLRVSEAAMEYLTLYHWPGNARQLANELRRLSALAEPGAVVMPEHLSPDIAASRPTAAAARAMTDAELLVRTDQPLAAATEHVERVLIAQALDQCGGNVEKAAQALGLSRKGLFLKRQRLGML